LKLGKKKSDRIELGISVNPVLTSQRSRRAEDQSSHNFH